MEQPARFQPGQTILLREVWRGKVWSARPEIVVQDTPELLVLFTLPGTRWKQPKNLSGERPRPADRASGGWWLQDVDWVDYTRLRLTVPGARYSVMLFRDYPSLERRSWYVNMEDPLRRTPLGFDYMDQLLDVLVRPDLSSWEWKDADELEEAVSLGLFTPAGAAALRDEAQRVAAWLRSGTSPFTGWERWRPDPSWRPGDLPTGWEVVA